MHSNLRDQLQTTLGTGYSIERELGGGGMSRVFVAHEQSLGRRVVIKVLPPELAAGVNLGRFRREIQLAAQLQHPHIVPVLTAGETEGLPFFTMPFVDGESLRTKLVRSGELPIPEALRLLRDIAKALAYAHRQGVVHRDIKPENILLSDDSALVTDFGVAKALSASSGSEGITSVGMALGTPAYMAPEQGSADPSTDHRADIYAFGALAYELLTGRSPFHGRPAQQMLAAHIAERPAPVDSLRPSAPPALTSLIMRCLEKHPADRPQSAAEVLAELDGLVTPSAGTMAATTPTSSAGTAAPGVSTGQALLVYAAAFVAVVGLARLAVMLLDVPDWVFPGAVIVMLLGIPMILMTALAHRTPQSTRGFFTWRRTVHGGIAATAVFAVLVLGYVVLRSLGFGPDGSLAAAGVLRDRESVLVADFTSPAQDTSLGSVVAEAFRTDLSQSSNLSVMPASAVRGVLARMARSDAPKLDLPLAREVAEREGIKLVVDGGVASVGSSYVLTARLVTADSGRVLAAFRETADDSRDLITAINRLTKKVRARVGESLRSVRNTPPLEQVTTSSLEALRKYAQGSRAIEYDTDFDRARALLEEAIALDTGFAMAWRKLGVVYGNLTAMASARDHAYRKAFEHRDRLTAIERYLTIGSYYAGVDRQRSITAYQSALELDPDNYIALNNIAIQYMRLRDYPRAAVHLRRGLQVAPRPSAYTNLAEVLVALDSVEEAKRLLDTAVVRYPTNASVAWAQWELPMAIGDYDAARPITRQAEERLPPNVMSRAMVEGARGVDARLHGRIAESTRLFERSWDFERQLGNASAPLRRALEEPWADIWYRGARASAVAEMDRVLERHPLDSIPPVDRPYPMLVQQYAEAGAPDRAARLLSHAERSLTREELEARTPGLHEMRGRIALADGRYDDAISEFRAIEADGCRVCVLPDMARAYDQLGNVDSAIAVYERYRDMKVIGRQWTDVDFLTGSLKRLGELYEQRGEKQKALEMYSRFVELWQGADPELQPLVREVRSRIERLRRAE